MGLEDHLNDTSRLENVPEGFLEAIRELKEEGAIVEEADGSLRLTDLGKGIYEPPTTLPDELYDALEDGAVYNQLLTGDHKGGHYEVLQSPGGITTLFISGLPGGIAFQITETAMSKVAMTAKLIIDITR